MSYAPRFTVRACLPNQAHSTYNIKRMLEMWSALDAEGKHRWLFYDGLVRDALDYVDFMLEPDVFAYAVYDPADDTPLATYFVNNFMGNAGQMHFCYLGAGLSRSRAIGIDTCNFLLRNGGLSALIGLTPQPFRHAWKFALEVGFVQKAIIPNACRVVLGGRIKTVNAVATLCTPETLKPYPEE